MKKGWQTKKLSEFYQIGSSKRVLKSQWKAEGVPFYRGREVTRLAADGFVENELFVSEKHFAELAKQYGVPKAGDIVITAIGTIGNSHVVRDSDRFYFKDASVLWMKRVTDISSEFINFWLKSPHFFDQLDRGNGATVDTLTIQKLQSVGLLIPPLPEQHRIVGILDEAFAGLATAKANAAKNLHNARALFDSHLQSVFSQRGKGWIDTKLGEVCGFQNGFAFKSNSFKESGEPILRISNIQDGQFDSRRLVFFNPKDYRENLDRYKVLKGDLLIAMSGGTTGKIGFNTEDTVFYLNQRVGKFEPGKNLDKRYLYYFLSTKVEENLKISAGSAQPNLSTEQIKGFVLPLPAIDEQRRIVATWDALNAETTRLAAIYQQKLAALEALKKSLLHQAFSGEL
jgi:type I restriction enzyme S subunit